MRKAKSRSFKQGQLIPFRDPITKRVHPQKWRCRNPSAEVINAINKRRLEGHSVEEAASWFGVSKRSYYRGIRNRKLSPPTKNKRRVRIQRTKIKPLDDGILRAVIRKSPLSSKWELSRIFHKLGRSISPRLIQEFFISHRLESTYETLAFALNWETTNEDGFYGLHQRFFPIFAKPLSLEQLKNRLLREKGSVSERALGYAIDGYIKIKNIYKLFTRIKDPKSEKAVLLLNEVEKEYREIQAHLDFFHNQQRQFPARPVDGYRIDFDSPSLLKPPETDQLISKPEWNGMEVVNSPPRRGT